MRNTYGEEMRSPLTTPIWFGLIMLLSVLIQTSLPLPILKLLFFQTARIGRQHLVLGTSASNRVTISNNYFNGVTSYSATCDGYAYWGIYFTGSNDLITLKGNYIYHFSGRSPKIQGNTLLHAVSYHFPHTHTSTKTNARPGQQLLVRFKRSCF